MALGVPTERPEPWSVPLRRARLRLLGWLTLLAVLIALPARAGEEVTVIAVARFADHADEPALAHGLAEMLATDLALVGALEVVERGRLGEVLTELELGASGAIDPETAAKVGQLVGARHLVLGSLVAVDPVLRIDARVVDTETGVATAAWTVEGPRDEFFLLEKELLHGLLQAIELTPTARDSARLSDVGTRSFEAFAAWSRAQQALDQGDVEAARVALTAALAHDERFERAARDLAATESRVAEAGATRTRSLSRDAAKVLDLLSTATDDPDLAVALAPWARLSEEDRCRLADDLEAIADAIVARDSPLLLPLQTPRGAVPAEEWAQATRITVRWCRGDREAVLAAGPAFLEAHALSPLYRDVEALVDAALDLEVAEQPGRELLVEAEAVLALRMDQALCAGRIQIPNEKLDGHIVENSEPAGSLIVDSAWIPYPERLPHCRAASRLEDIDPELVWVDEALYGSVLWHTHEQNRDLDEAWLVMAEWDRTPSDLDLLLRRVQEGPHWNEGCTWDAWVEGFTEGPVETHPTRSVVLEETAECAARSEAQLATIQRLQRWVDGVPRLGRALREVDHPDDAAALLRDHASQARLGEVRDHANRLLERWPTSNGLHQVAIEAAWAAGDVDGMATARDAWFAAEELEPPSDMPAPKATGQGLTATLYADLAAAQPVHTAALRPNYRPHDAELALPPHQAVVFEGWIVAPETGEWTLSARRKPSPAPMTLRLLLDGQVLIDRPSAPGGFTQKVQTSIEGGVRTPIRIEASWDGPPDHAALPFWTWKLPPGSFHGIKTRSLFGTLPERAAVGSYHLPPYRIATGERLQVAVTTTELAWRAFRMLDLGLYGEAARAYLELATTWEAYLNVTVRLLRNYSLRSYAGILAVNDETFLTATDYEPFYLRFETQPADFAPWILATAVELADRAHEPELAREAAEALMERWPESEALELVPRRYRR